MRGIWVGGSGNSKVVTVDAMFDVLVGDRCMPFLSTSPTHMPAISMADRLGRCVYLRVNDDDDVAAEEAAEEELSVCVGDGDGEDEVDFEVRSSDICFGLWGWSTLAGELLRTCTCKLGGWSGLAGTMRVVGTYLVVSMVVILVPATLKVEVKLLRVVLEPLLVLEVTVGRLGRKPDGSGGTGGIEAVDGSIEGGIIFTASSDLRSTVPNLPSSLGEFK